MHESVIAERGCLVSLWSSRVRGEKGTGPPERAEQVRGIGDGEGLN